VSEASFSEIFFHRLSSGRTIVRMGTLSNPPSIERPTRVRFGVLGFGCSLALLTYLDRICIMQAKDAIRNDLGFDENSMGLVFSAFIFGYLLLEVPGGWMGDRWGSRRVLAGIVLAWSLFTALTGCVWPFVWDSGRRLELGGFVISLALDSLAVMLLIRFLFGLGEAGAFPNLTRVIGNWFPVHERASALGWIWTFARLGGALAPVVLSQLTLLLGWRQAFWLFGLAGVAWTVYFYWRFRDRPEEDPHCNDSERALIRPTGTATESGGHAWPSWRVLFGSLTVWAVCAASFFINLGWYFYATWQPKFWQEVYEIPAAKSGWLTGAPFVCGAIGTMLGGRWSDRLLRRGGSRRWSRAVIGITGYVLAGSCVLAVGFTSEVWQAETLLCLGFLVNDLTVPIIWAVCSDVGGRFSGTLSGLMNMIGGIGALISPALLPRAHSALHEHFDHAICWRIIFVGLASSWFLGALSWLFIDAGKPLVAADSATHTS
jgi:MFS transporter, ACS family, glucarate transporter